MTQGVRISVTATDEQIQGMEMQCDMMEGLMSLTLAKKIEGMPKEKSVEYIRDWFKTIRVTAQSAFMASGIKSYCAPMLGPSAKEVATDSYKSHVQKMEAVVAMFKQHHVALDVSEMEVLWNALGGQGPLGSAQNEAMLALRCEVLKLIKGWWNYMPNATMMKQLNDVLRGQPAPEFEAKKE